MSELIADKRSPWTFDELRSLPESPWRYEVVDGSLVMSPAPGLRHEVVSSLLRAAIAQQAPAQLVIGPIGIDLHPTYRIPDLVVVERSLGAGADRRLLQAADVHLVVEVVSPASTTTDRVTKPAQYAAAGVEEYWRVETEPHVSISVYRLQSGDGVYTEVGTWAEGEVLEAGGALDLRIVVGDCAP